ncbi:hydrogenase nickel incorporation protein HypB [soil metagenome]
MCTTCGCSDDAKPKVINLQTGQSTVVPSEISSEHSHKHEHSHDHKHGQAPAHGHDHDHHHSHADEQQGHDHSSVRTSTIVSLEEKILAKNDLIAARNRGWFEGCNILALNLVSAPGSGKTALLERTISDLQKELFISVVEGDQATVNDAERIKKSGCPVVQINTGAGCHLDAQMLATGLKQLNPPRDSVLFIENVGNLVCPALFDLGEMCKIAILSVTEGEDKPVKYPHMFRAAELLILNKIDLLPHLDFDIEACKTYALSVNPKLKIFEVSVRSGDGLEAWYDWLRQALACARH